MNGLIYFVTILVAILIYRRVSAAIKENKDKKAMKTENELTRSAYDILLAVLADRGCRILGDEQTEEHDEDVRRVAFIYSGVTFVALAATGSQFFILRFFIDTEIKDELAILRLANHINHDTTVIKVFAHEYAEDQSKILICSYNSLCVTSDNIIELLDNMLRCYLYVDNSLSQLEKQKNAENSL